jgi:hypothetical protein
VLPIHDYRTLQEEATAEFEAMVESHFESHRKSPKIDSDASRWEASAKPPECPQFNSRRAFPSSRLPLQILSMEFCTCFVFPGLAKISTANI